MRRRRSAGLGLTLAVSLMAGCTGVANLHIPTPPPGASAGGVTSTTGTDLSGVTLTPLPSAPPTTVVLAPGAASLSGVVTGPLGPVGGATVLVERLVGDAVGGRTVATAADGSWHLTGILGGRYRVRAWRPPDLTVITPQILLVGRSDNANVALNLMAYSGVSVSATVAPNPPQVGVPTTLVVQATQQVVGSDGVVRTGPFSGAPLTLSAAGAVVFVGTNPAPTDATGKLTLIMGCATPGPVGLSGTFDGVTSIPIAVPDCTPAAVTPSTVTSPTVTPTTQRPVPPSVP